MIDIEGIVAGGDRRMGREYRGRPDLRDRLGEGHSGDGQLPNPLEHHERGVALVGVPHARVEPDGSENSDPTHPKEPFLPKPKIGSPGVELAQEGAVFGVIGLEIGVEQIQRHPPHLHGPDPDVNRAAECLDHRQVGLAVIAPQLHQRRYDRVDVVIAVFLPAVGPEPLVEVAFHVRQPDPDERKPEVGGGLAVVAGENAEPATVDRNRVVKSELGAEVGDRAAPHVGVAAPEPGPIVLPIPRHPGHDPVVPSQEGGVVGQFLQARRRHLAQHFDRVMPSLPPQGRVDGPEQVAGLAVPAPRQVRRQGGQTLEPGR